MKKINFEYNQSTLPLNATAVSFTLVSVAIFFLLLSDRLQVPIEALFIFLSIIPSLTFFIYRKKMKAQGSAVFGSEHVEFNLNGSNLKIYYSEIRDFKTEIGRGPSGFCLTIYKKDGSKLQLGANKLLCNPSFLKELSFELARTIQEYKRTT